jgi:hypothetical protein
MNIELKDVQEWLESEFGYNLDESVEYRFSPNSNLDFFGFASNSSSLQSLSDWDLLLYVPETKED